MGNVGGSEDHARPTAGAAAGDSTQHTFVAELWVWDARRNDSWTFVTVPADVSAAVEDLARARGPRAGFGSVKVAVRVGTTTWATSVFPDAASKCYVLPVKRSVRVANEIDAGDRITVDMRVV